MNEVKQEPFLKYVSFSVFGHVAVILFFTVKLLFFPSENIEISNAIRVDMVALPDKKIPQVQQSIEKKEPPKAVVEPPKENKPKEKKLQIKNTKQEQNKALDRLKALSALENFKSEVEEVKNEPPVKQSELYKGNVITKGSDLKGLSQLQYNEYLDKLEKHVKGYWVLPQWLADSNLKALIKVTIDERGYITSKEIQTSSGDSVFDGKALEAIDKASPCPIAPKNLQTLLAHEGIIFKFP
ncbi:MAG: TonB family protein [Bdellovibrionales bacterium]|nr:TonB family protein [Bdellovibrionales bacterium]